MLRWRLILGTLIIAALAGLLWLDHQAAVPGAWLAPLLVFFTVGASSEVLHLARSAGLRPLPWVVHAGNLLLVFGSWAPYAFGNGGIAGIGLIMEAWPLAALAAATLLAFVGEMARYEKPGGILANLGATIFGLVYVGVLLSFAVQLRLGWGMPALASLILVVKMGDIGAYTVGRLIGRHKMAPTLSPGKTIEGAIGALVFACAASWATFTWLAPLGPAFHGEATNWIGWLAYGLAIGVVGILGDLAESLLKRDAGCKDSSTWLPGFGGVLDILDSILMAAPVAWLFWATGIVG